MAEFAVLNWRSSVYSRLSGNISLNTLLIECEQLATDLVKFKGNLDRYVIKSNEEISFIVDVFPHQTPAQAICGEMWYPLKMRHTDDLPCDIIELPIYRQMMAYAVRYKHLEAIQWFNMSYPPLFFGKDKELNKLAKKMENQLNNTLNQICQSAIISPNLYVRTVASCIISHESYRENILALIQSGDYRYMHNYKYFVNHQNPTVRAPELTFQQYEHFNEQYPYEAYIYSLPIGSNVSIVELINYLILGTQRNYAYAYWHLAMYLSGRNSQELMQINLPQCINMQEYINQLLVGATLLGMSSALQPLYDRTKDPNVYLYDVNKSDISRYNYLKLTGKNTDWTFPNSDIFTSSRIYFDYITKMPEKSVEYKQKLINQLQHFTSIINL